MSEIFVCMTLLPVIFMFHDFEEVIFMKYWYGKNSAYLKRRVPGFYPMIEKIMRGRTTASFAMSVFFMFMLVSATTFYSVLSGNYLIWWGAFLIFSLHLLIHIAQAIIVRRYVPAVVTSVLCLPYAIWGYSLMNNMFMCRQTLVVLVIGLSIVIGWLVLAYKIGEMFYKRFNV